MSECGSLGKMVGGRIKALRVSVGVNHTIEALGCVRN